MTPVVGQRVRRVAPHRWLPIGQLGTIDKVHANSHDFWVALDHGGWNGWTHYGEWEPIEKKVAP